MTMMTTLKSLMAAAALSVVAVSAQAATVTPTIGGGGLGWSFGFLSGDNVSDTAIDVATDLPKFIDFFALPTIGSLSITIENSGIDNATMAVGQLQCLAGCTAGTYTLSYDGMELFSVVSGAAQEMGIFAVAAGTTGDLVWSWDIPVGASAGAISSNLSAVPVPAAGLLLLGGLGAFAAVRRRQKKS